MKTHEAPQAGNTNTDVNRDNDAGAARVGRALTVGVTAAALTILVAGGVQVLLDNRARLFHEATTPEKLGPTLGRCTFEPEVGRLVITTGLDPLKIEAFNGGYDTLGTHRGVLPPGPAPRTVSIRTETGEVRLVDVPTEAVEISGSSAVTTLTLGEPVTQVDVTLAPAEVYENQDRHLVTPIMPCSPA